MIKSIFSKTLAVAVFSMAALTHAADIIDQQLPPALFLPEALLPKDAIPASTAPVDIPKNLYSQMNANDFSYEYMGATKTLDDFFDEAKVRSLLILKDGEIVYEKNSFPYGRYSRQQSWSINKQILSILLGIAIDEGTIDSVNDPMDMYDSRLSNNGYAGVSFRQALQMSSGIKFNEVIDRYNLIFDVINNYYSFGGSGLTLEEATLSPELVNDYEPDSRFEYTSVNSQAIAMALSAATGMSIQDYLSQKLWEPMWLDKANILVDREHTEFTFCCLYANSRTYAAIGLLYANKGMYNGKQLVSEEWVTLSTTFADPNSWHAEDMIVEGEPQSTFGFAYHWWPIEGNRGDFTALGVYGQSIHVLPEQNVVIVRLSGDFEGDAHRAESVVFGRAIADYID